MWWRVLKKIEGTLPLEVLILVCEYHHVYCTNCSNYVRYKIFEFHDDTFCKDCYKKYISFK